MKIASTILVLSVALLTAMASRAAEPAQEFIKAKPVQSDKPKYPRQDLKNRNQAWVDVAFCIDEAGATQNIKIIDSVGNERFVAADELFHKIRARDDLSLYELSKLWQHGTAIASTTNRTSRSGSNGIFRMNGVPVWCRFAASRAQPST